MFERASIKADPAPRRPVIAGDPQTARHDESANNR
jgi:hypothetical protein